jgi:uncharacterized membrane protein YkvI
MGSTFKRLFLPGLVFQSICIAGGYGTGRELVEFFLQFGPVGGLLGMLFPATIVISVGSAICYELARKTRSYDYRKFLKLLMGRGWFLYEIAYLVTVLLVLAVVTAAIGSLMSETFGIPDTMGSVSLLVAIAFLVFKGTKVIERVMSVWSFVLYSVYVSIFVASMIAFGDLLSDGFAKTANSDGWLLSGFRYGSLSLSLVPAILFATTHIESRRDAMLAGLLTGPLFIIPAVLFFIAMVPHYPAIVDRPVPINYILEVLDLRWLQLAFIVMLVGTFIETGSGMIHAINERIAGALEAVDKSLSGRNRALIAIGLLIAALLMSRFGIIDLISVGYGALAWIYMLILILPMFTIGVWKLVKPPSA